MALPPLTRDLRTPLNAALPSVSELSHESPSNVMLMCEAPAHYSPSTSQHAQVVRQAHSVKFGGRFYGVRQKKFALTEPVLPPSATPAGTRSSSDKLTSPGMSTGLLQRKVSSKSLARSSRKESTFTSVGSVPSPEGFGEWKSAHNKPESVISRMHHSAAEQLKPPPKRKEVHAAGGTKSPTTHVEEADPFGKFALLSRRERSFTTEKSLRCREEDEEEQERAERPLSLPPILKPAERRKSKPFADYGARSLSLSAETEEDRSGSIFGPMVVPEAIQPHASSIMFMEGPSPGASPKGTEGTAVAAVEAQQEIAFFDSVVEERLALEAFLSAGRQKTIPNMVMKQFRQNLCEGELIERLKEVPLAHIEKCVKEVGLKALTLAGFNGLLHKILRGQAYLRAESQGLFNFFDANEDGDVDHRELYNGFVLILSKDGPLVSVIHRMTSMVKPRQSRDTRLSCMSRFELCVMAEAIQTVTPPHLMTKVETEMKTMFDSFICDKRGLYPFDQVRDKLCSYKTVYDVIVNTKLPRDPELYDSFLSLFFRTTDSEEGEQSFKVMKNEKAERRLKLEQQKQWAQRHSISSGQVPTPLGVDLSHLEDDGSRGGASEQGASSRMLLDPAFANNPERLAPKEPGNPNFFTLKGILYRQVDGEEPKQYWVNGMQEQKVKYTLDPRDGRLAAVGGNGTAGTGTQAPREPRSENSSPW